METARVVFGFALAALNFVYWWLVARRWHERFRRWVERHYRVEIGRTSRGHWEVRGDGSWLRRFAIEWLQLVYFVAAFVVWGAALSGALVALGQR